MFWFEIYFDIIKCHLYCLVIMSFFATHLYCRDNKKRLCVGCNHINFQNKLWNGLNYRSTHYLTICNPSRNDNILLYVWVYLPRVPPIFEFIYHMYQQEVDDCSKEHLSFISRSWGISLYWGFTRTIYLAKIRDKSILVESSNTTTALPTTN